MKVADVGRILSIPISQVVPNPDQPRKRFDDDALRALSASIAENGLLQPVTVRARGDGSFELIAGERRLEATRLLGRREIAAIVVDASPGKSAELALIENIQRADLSPFEQADAFRRLREEHGCTQEEIARKMGLSQSAVANKLRLLGLDGNVRRVCEENGLSERHARALLRLDGRLRLEAARSIARRNLNVQQAEQYIEGLLRDRSPRFPRKAELRDARLFINTVEKAVSSIRRMGIQVEADHRAQGGYVEYILRLPVNSGGGGAGAASGTPTGGDAPAGGTPTAVGD